MEHLHTVAMITLFLIIGLIAFKVQKGLPISSKKDKENTDYK